MGLEVIDGTPTAIAKYLKEHEIEEYEKQLILCARCERFPVDRKGAVCGACVDEIDHN